MASLKDALTQPGVIDRVVTETLDLIDAEVQKKSGISGMAIKGGYKTVKGIKPGFLEKVVRDLVPEFAAALDPIYAEAAEGGGDVAGHFAANTSRAADALLGITDQKAERSTNRAIKAAYSKLRGMAKSNVEQAIPGLGEIIARHAS